MKKITKRILTVVLALTMVLGMTTMVGATVAGTGLKVGGGFLTKTLALSEGAAVPTREFTFDFELVSVDGRPGNATNMPALSAKVNFTPGDALDGTTKVPGFETVTKNTNDFTITTAAGGTVTWPHAGEYVYNVTETQQAGPIDSNYTYSEAKYQVTVFVTNVMGGDPPRPTGAVQIDSVGFRALIDDEGEAVDEVGGFAPKTDPVFVNRFVPPTTFETSKEVAGTYADTTMKFDYTLQVTRPNGGHSLDVAPATYTGVIFNADNQPATTSPNTVTLTFVQDATTATATFQLSHGQYLRFENRETGNPGFDEGITGIPTGFKYVLTEAGKTGYTPSVKVWVNKAALSETPITKTGTLATDLVVGGGDAPLDTPVVLGDKINQADWTNTYKIVTPTGILLNNLPYILLILVAAGGFVFYIADKRRKATK